MFDASGNKFYLHTDQLGSTRAVTNATKTTVQTFSYYPFGNVLTTTGSNTDYKFNGKEFDEESYMDLYYYGARYYDPKIGRFISIDPIVNYNNPYSYVRNNPLNYTDPSGMDPTGYMRRTGQTGTNTRNFAREGFGLGRGGATLVGDGWFGTPNLERPSGSAGGGGRYINKLALASLRMFLRYFAEKGPLILGGRPFRGQWRFTFIGTDGLPDMTSKEIALEHDLAELRFEAWEAGLQTFDQTKAEAFAAKCASFFGLNPAAVLAMIATESSWNPTKIGEEAGEIGLGQINPNIWGKTDYAGKTFIGQGWRDNWGLNIFASAAIYAHYYFDYATKSSDDPYGFGYAPGSTASYQSAYSLYNGGPEAGDRFRQEDDVRDQHFIDWYIYYNYPNHFGP